MSMMWMRMHGQTWLASATSFLLMWLAMMVVMMLPSTLPMLVKSRRSFAEGKSANSSVSISLIASGYFAMWLAVGAVIYALGIAFAATAMRWESFSRAVPGLAGAALVAAGAIQFTRWKMSSLLRCRTPFGRVVSCQADEADFLLGCKQGAACCICCTAPMVIQLALGVMNPFVMVGVAIIIAAEKLLPRPEIIARIVGLSAIVAGIATISMILMRKS